MRYLLKHHVVSSLCILLFLLITEKVEAQSSKLQWMPREDLNVLLPPSVRVYETNGLLTDGARVRAMYATVDLRDKNLRLRAIGSNSLRETTLDTYERHNALLAINGGYFSSTKSESALVSDGEIIAWGPRNFTRGAFGMVNRKPQIVWPYIDSTSAIYRLTTPVDIKKLKPAELHKKLQPWHPALVVGAGPVLLKAGKIKDSSLEEGFGGSHLLRHPRSAIGYIDENILVMMVVDGRQQSSAGVTITELAQIMFDIGCYEAVNLDGGGSSAMVAADEVVNVPVDLPNGNRHSLRRNASALILTEEIPSINRELVIIDTDSDQFQESGIWKNSNHINYYGSTTSREAQANAFNHATYRFKGINPGKFQLSAWWTVNETNSARSIYVLHRGTKIDSLVVDQTEISANGRWNVLGEFHLSPDDFIEIVSNSPSKKIIADAIRLVRLSELEIDPKRGDLRVAVISDLNSGLGSATYEWQVDSIMKRIPRHWKPDLVLCGGDMVAGMGVADTATLTKMWNGFSEHIFNPLKSSKIPFAFTIGNHDGLRSYPAERKAIENFWMRPENETGLKFVDRTHFPHYYSFIAGNSFFVSWDASSSEITNENLAWLDNQFKSHEASNAKSRFVVGHLPIYSVAQERDSKGNVLNQGDSLRKILESHNVKVYISGHQHAYYPGKRGNLQLLNCGAAGSGPRRWLTTDKQPVNTITIMDVFYERDTIVYTTYDIKQKAAEDMNVFDYHNLPASINGVNGIIIRNDVHVADWAEGTMHNTIANSAAGYVSVTIKEKTIGIEADLASHGKLLNRGNAVTFFLGKHSEKGEPILSIPVKKNVTHFKQSIDLIDGLAEAISAGACYVTILTDKFPNGELRGQLYPRGNSLPERAVITSHDERNEYGIRNSLGLYRFSWTSSRDLDGHDVTYEYQLAEDSLFTKIILHQNTARQNFFKLAEAQIFKLLGGAPVGQPLQFYHRVNVTDGLSTTIGKTITLRLSKSNEPLVDFVELDPQRYVSDGKIAGAEGQGSGALFDTSGKLWLADYGGTLYAKMPDGKDALFSPLRSVVINAKEYSLKPINGIGLDLDGNVLVGNNRLLIKINASTGEGMAVWQTPEGKRAITSPRVNEKGEIYCMSLFAEDPNYVLKQSSSSPGTFDLIRTIVLPKRILARTFDMSSDGLKLYFPDPGSAIIQVFTSTDGINYKRNEDLTSTAAGSNAIKIAGDKLFATARPSGVSGATLHFRDEKQKVMWTLPLPELDGAEARGMTVSDDLQTVIICSWDKGGGFYRYTKK